MSAQISQAVASVLSRSKVKLAHPGGSQLHEFYASPANCTSHLAESIQSFNRLRVTSNNLLLGSQTNFTISTSSIVTSMFLQVSLDGSTGYKTPHDGWLFDAINSLEVSFSNSLLQSMVLSGTAIRDYCLLTCKNRWDREQMLKLAGSGFSGAGTLTASIPVAHVLASAAYQSGQFGLDFSVLNGPVQLAFNWNPGYKFTVKTNAAFAPPTSWASCQVVGTTSDLVDSSFAVRSAMSMDPSLIYSTPGKYLNSITYPLSGVSPDVETSINLQSAPAGMLSAIILNIRPNSATNDSGGPPTTTSSNWVGRDTGLALIHGESVQLSSLRLAYGGQNLVDCRSNAEIQAMLTAAFDGDDLSYDIRSCRQAGTDATVGQQVYHTNVLCIPFGYNMRKIMSEKLTENLPGYAGASMQLFFTVDQCTYSANATPYTEADDPNVIQDNLQYLVSVTYVIEALIEVSQGTVDMQI